MKKYIVEFVSFSGVTTIQGTIEAHNSHEALEYFSQINSKAIEQLPNKKYMYTVYEVCLEGFVLNRSEFGPLYEEGR